MATAKKNATTTEKTRSIKIPNEQLDLPVAFNAAGDMMTLRQVMKQGRGSALSLAALSPEKRAELTVKRIEGQPEYEVAMVGGGLVNKERAIEEVRAQTELGKNLTEIEQMVIEDVLAGIADR